MDETRAIMRRRLWYLAKTLIKDRRKTYCNEPWKWRNRWRFWKKHYYSMRLYSIVMKNKKDAGIKYRSQAERTGVVLNCVSMYLPWLMREDRNEKHFVVNIETKERGEQYFGITALPVDVTREELVCLLTAARGLVKRKLDGLQYRGEWVEGVK
jgi:hypothetical protein|tara:strand:+ start:1324 stop:1785 length:462 start_codon:yes stop_codon:yes gene_type:complete